MLTLGLTMVKVWTCNNVTEHIMCMNAYYVHECMAALKLTI